MEPGVAIKAKAMAAPTVADVEKIGEGLTLVFRFAHQLTVAFAIRLGYDNMGGFCFHCFIVQRGNRYIKILLLCAVIYGYLDGSALDSHGEIELRAYARILVARLGAAAPRRNRNTLHSI